MKDELVSFETAKLAKEKGFEEPTIHMYNKDGIEEHCFEYAFSEFTKEEVNAAKDNNEIVVLAPTQSLLQRWLREKHHLHIIPIFIHEELGYVNYHISVIDYKKGRTRMRNAGFNKKWSYEEALEIGLQEALKLIK